MRSLLGTLVALLLAAATPAAAGPRPLRWTLDLTTGAGASDNVFESELNVRSGAFASLGLEASLGRRTPGFRWQVDLEARGHRYLDRDLQRGDEESADLSARWQWDVRRDAARPVRLRLKTTASADRTQLTSRFAPGEDVVAGGGVSLLHRYDADQIRLDWDVTFGSGRDLEWGVGGLARWRDYLRDYEDVPGVDSLDFRELGVDAFVDWQAHPAVKWGARLEVARRDYDERFVRDASGVVVPGLATTYREVGLTTDARFQLGPHVRAWLLVQHEERRDDHVGYDDRLRDRALMRWYFEPTDRLELRWTAEAERLDSPHAHVGYDPAKPLRRSWDRQLTLDVSLRLGARWTLTGTLARERHASRTPGYTYDRDVVALAFTHHWGGAIGRAERAAPRGRGDDAEPAAAAPRAHGAQAD